MIQSVAELKTAKDKSLSRRDYVLLPLISMLTIVAMLVLSEFAAREADKVMYSAPFWGNYSLDTLFTADQLGKRGRPNASYEKWRLNEAGYRGPALRSNTYRIVCLGSSETFGLYEKDGGEWPRVLERDLNTESGGNQYEVVNAAYPGMSLPSILKRARYTEDTLRPKLVVVYPSFTSYIEDLDDQSTAEPASATQQKAPPVSPPHWWAIDPRITGILQTALKSHLPEQAQTWIRKVEIERAERNLHVMTSLPQSQVDKFQSDLDQLVHTIQQGRTDVILVTHATRFSTPLTVEDRKYLIMWRRFYPQLSESGLIDMESRMNAAMRAVADRDGVPLVDAAKLIEPGGQNFQEFTHFSDQGADELGTLVAQQVLKKTM
jgi:lysophospholipase L1-like esterase